MTAGNRSMSNNNPLPATTSGTPQVSVVIPTFRRFRPLLDTLRDLRAQSYSRFEILIGDQNPSWPHEFHQELAEVKQDPRIHWFVFDRPGVVTTRNECVRRSSGDIILFVDDDVCIPDVDFVARHVRNYSDSRVDAVAGRECRPETNTRPPASFARPPEKFESAAALTTPTDMTWTRRCLLEQTLCFDRNRDLRAEVCVFSTCNGSIRRQTFARLGGFDESFRGNSYGDDYDLAIRLVRSGGAIVYDPDPWLIHLAAPIGGLRLTDRTNRSSERDRAAAPLLFFFRHARRGWYLHLLYRHVLRKTVLLRNNLLRPWRQPVVWIGVFSAIPAAIRAARTTPPPWQGSVVD
jgi:GT2 family glycosyltransferase